MSTQLTVLRNELLNLHKALLEYQKRTYEVTNGAVENSNKYFDLVVNNPSFAWLRTLSALVVSIDELLENTEGVSEEKTKQIFAYTKKLLTATEDTTFAENYTKALQEDPRIADLHAQILAVI